jgi:hypothetical protein
MVELVKNNRGLEILTDSGWETFDGVLIKGTQTTLIIRTEKTSIQCTPDHQLFINQKQKKTASTFRPRDKIYTSDGKYDRVIEVKMSGDEKVYDILNVGKNHRFFANNLLVSNCEFIIDEETLIDSIVLSELEGTDPIYKTGQVRWYKKPTKGHIYVTALDPSLGTGGDAAAIQVFEADTTEQVAEWRHNRTPIPEQIKLLAAINKEIVENTKEPNNLYYSLENNTIGEAALISLAEYGEENIQGIMVSEPKSIGNVRRYRRGFNTTNKSKLSACSKFKNLLESNKLKIRSSMLISELKTFVASGGSYAAKIGETDDLVMSSLLVVRIFQHLQNFHVDLDQHIRDHNEELEPMPFVLVMG